jgi:hypothetical protein
LSIGVDAAHLDLVLAGAAGEHSTRSRIVVAKQRNWPYMSRRRRRVGRARASCTRATRWRDGARTP